jgi:hypothetical protein
VTFTSLRVSEKFYLNREDFEWVFGEVEAKFNQSVILPKLQTCVLKTLRSQIIQYSAYHGLIALRIYFSTGGSSLKKILSAVCHLRDAKLDTWLNQ